MSLHEMRRFIDFKSDSLVTRCFNGEVMTTRELTMHARSIKQARKIIDTGNTGAHVHITPKSVLETSTLSCKLYSCHR